MTDLADAVRALASPWLDSEAAAAHLRISVRQFRERVAVQPGFPAPRQIGKVGLRWKRSEIDAWVDRQPSLSATASIDGA